MRSTVQRTRSDIETGMVQSTPSRPPPTVHVRCPVNADVENTERTCVNKTLPVFVVLLAVVCATAKEVTVQITGVEALTITIPEEWEANVQQIDVPDVDHEGPVEFIYVGPPLNMGPFSVGDDIPEEQPFLTIDPKPRLCDLYELRTCFRFTKLPLHFDDGNQRVIIEEIHDSSGSVAGYYQLYQEEDQIRLMADVNTTDRTWSATARYSAADNQFTDNFIAVINSIVNAQNVNRSAPAPVLTTIDNPSADGQPPPDCPYSITHATESK